MAPTKPFLLYLFSLTLLSASNAAKPPKTLHIPVIHRDPVLPLPPPPDATPGSFLRRRLAADAARYTALTSLDSPGHGHLHAPVIAGLPFDSGEYFALVGFGTPSTSALLVIDTGSDLVWLQCAPCRRCYDQVSPLYDPRSSRTYKQIACDSPECHRLRFPRCDNHTGGCRYVVAYGDGSTTVGDLGTDRLLFSNDSSVLDVALGCGRDNEGLFDSAAGLLGIGRGNMSFPTQVAGAYGHIFAYCLGDRQSHSRSTSYLVFGRSPELPSTVFTLLLSNPRRRSLYYVNMIGFSVGGEWVTGFPNNTLALDPVTGQGGVVVDSGTAISRFTRDAYTAVRDAFDTHATTAGMQRSARTFSLFDSCYDLRGRAKAKVPRLVLHFAGGADMALPPENYLVPVGSERHGAYYCLGLAAADDGLNVLGNVQQQGFRMVFDVERERFGFAPNGC